MKKALFLISCVASYASLGMTTVTNIADFVTGVNTNGWNVSAAGWTSPTYPASVATVAVTGTNFADGAELNVANHANSFSVSSAGGARLTSFAAVYTLSKLPAPVGLLVTNVIDCGFSASWSSVPDAVGYRLNFYSNVLEGVSAGSEVFAEHFSRVPSKGNATALDADTFNAITDTRIGWFFDACYYAVTPVSNIVQIGTSSGDGWLAMPTPNGVYGSGYTLEFTASRLKDAGVGMPISVVSSAGITNWIGTVGLSTNASSFHLALPALSATDAIYFHSTTNKKDGRVLLKSVRILEGYDPGRLVETYFGSAEVVGASFATNGMPTVDGKVSVTALAAEAKDDSDESARIDLPLADPPLVPILRAWPIASADGNYDADFDGLAGVTVNRTPWYNGVAPIPYWMCYRDNGTIVTEVGVGTTNTTTSGLFRYHDNWYGHGEALGWRGSSERSFYTGIAFVNRDSNYSRRNFRLSFYTCQWNYRNEVPMTNTVEYLVTNELVGTAVSGNWIELPILAITPPYTAEDNDNGAVDWWGGLMEANIPGLILHPGEYLIIRFSDLKTKSSGGIGIAEFRLASERKPQMSCIVFR